MRTTLKLDDDLPARAAKLTGTAADRGCAFADALVQ